MHIVRYKNFLRIILEALLMYITLIIALQAMSIIKTTRVPACKWCKQTSVHWQFHFRLYLVLSVFKYTVNHLNNAVTYILYCAFVLAKLIAIVDIEWRRQLWGTEARSPLDFQLFSFWVTSEPHKLLKFDFMWWLPIQ